MQLRWCFFVSASFLSSSRCEEQMADWEVAVMCAGGRTDECDCVSICTVLLHPTLTTTPTHRLQTKPWFFAFRSSGPHKGPSRGHGAGGGARHIISLPRRLCRAGLMDSRPSAQTVSVAALLETSFRLFLGSAGSLSALSGSASLVSFAGPVSGFCLRSSVVLVASSKWFSAAVQGLQKGLAAMALLCFCAIFSHRR